ncbi:hypothetical protein J7E83_17180 [Arthrobacter sp. ISL-48]|uniref:hypothetical protein n=1 Tax=Arthrobacter sp. ISL-48 TaxID=2819110 RepID=UPI001BEA3553|nr:hypothetical protein [Arthrobacter sp. ISL-48]MBT2533827.1 hypothetical protein [Arthrobacter sp. ISL-48]
MLLLNSLNLLLDARRNGDNHSYSGKNGKTGFPTGQLTSAAWEGWWHEDAA